MRSGDKCSKLYSIHLQGFPINKCYFCNTHYWRRPNALRTYYGQLTYSQTTPKLLPGQVHCDGIGSINLCTVCNPTIENESNHNISTSQLLLIFQNH